MKLLKAAVCLTAVMLLSGSALAGVALTAHDLNAPAFANIAVPDARICMPCHTPHNGADATIVGPLWNHDISATANPGGYTVYDAAISATFDGGAILYGPQTVACLACHDGTVAMEAFGGGPAGSTMIGTLPGNGDLGIILSNDHPVGFDYEASATADPTGIRLSTAAGVTGTIAEDMLFGAGSDRMECASCHDVHDNSVVGQQPFLIKTNIGSALCTTCHIK